MYKVNFFANVTEFLLVSGMICDGIDEKSRLGCLQHNTG